MMGGKTKSILEGKHTSRSNIIGMDFGYSTTDVVFLTNKKICNIISVDSKLIKNKKHFFNYYKKFGKIKVTGGKTKAFPGHVDEIRAIGLGGSFLAKKKSCLVVSLGTGTCMVSVKGKKIGHIGGSGIGGGTLLGLSHHLAGIENLDKLICCAAKGRISSIDVSVKDIIGSGIGKVPAWMTASNFGNMGKISSAKKEDKILAAMHLVAESLAMLIIMSAKYAKQKDIVLVGKLARIKKIMDIMQQVAKIYKTRFIIPQYAGVGTAIGAALA